MQETKKNEPVARYGDWKVMADGMLINDERRFFLSPDRLREPDWWARLHFGIPWMSDQWNTFMPAWAKACEVAGIETVNIKISL